MVGGDRVCASFECRGSPRYASELPTVWGFRVVSENLLAEVGRGFAGDFLEGAIELGEGLEADFEGDFADAAVWIREEALGLLDAEASEVVDESDAGRVFEDLAEVADAGVDGFGSFFEGEGAVVVVFYVLAGFADGVWLDARFADGDGVSDDGKVIREGGEHADEAFVLGFGEHFCLVVGFFEFLEIDLDSPVDELFGELREFFVVR